MKAEEHYDYEVYVDYLGMSYRVECDLWGHGIYNLIPSYKDTPSEWEIVSDPQFYNFKITDLGIDLEVIPENEPEVLLIATEILKDRYWTQELSY